MVIIISIFSSSSMIILIIRWRQGVAPREIDGRNVVHLLLMMMMMMWIVVVIDRMIHSTSNIRTEGQLLRLPGWFLLGVGRVGLHNVVVAHV